MSQLLTKRSSVHKVLPTLRKQSGAVAVIIALSLVGLIGFMGLALDLGKLFVAKTELQNSVDACALAAARELTGANNNQLILAEAAGITTGERHRVYFQGEDISISGVTFSVSLVDDYRSASAIDAAEAVEMRYARCEANRADILNWFIQVLNLLPGVDIGSQTVAASAVATLSPSQVISCAIPVGLCSDDVPPSTPIGTWVKAPTKDSSKVKKDSMWVDYSPPYGGQDELADQFKGPGVCNLQVQGSQVAGDTNDEPGAMSALSKSWNSRFGIYQGNAKEDDAIPDYSGYAYTEVNWPSKFNALSDFQSKRSTNAPYQGDASTGLNVTVGEGTGTGGTTVADTTYLKTHGEDRRLATVAVIDCDSLTNGSSTVPVQAWACVLMLHPYNHSQGKSQGKDKAKTSVTQEYLEYLGRSNDAGSPCATNGVPAGPTGIGPMVPALVR